MTMIIKTATAEYTGGGIYIYHGQLQDGNYFRTCDDWETIEICNADTSVEDANYIEFYEEHRVEILVEDGYRRFWNQMIHWIIQNQPDGNYATNELENRLLEESVEITFSYEEVQMLSDGLLALMRDVNEAVRLVRTEKGKDCLHDIRRQYHELNQRLKKVLEGR